MKKLGRPRKPIDFKIDDNGCFICTSHAKGKWGHCIMGKDNKSIPVYRHVYEECFGEISEGLLVRHKCDNGSCINPEHLELGTQADNLKDMVDRGRSRKGTKHHNTKLTENDIVAIKENKDKLTNVKLAEKYGINVRQIYRIKSGERWGHMK